MTYLFSTLCSKKAEAFLFIFAVLAVFTSPGCAPGDYGHFVFSTSADDIFESGIVLDDHTYYYIGPDAEPVAIMAISSTYQLAPGLWKKISLTADQLRAWNSRIDNRYRRSDVYRGAEIVDQNNTHIGFWYSSIDWTVVRKGEGNTYVIFTPDTTQNRDREKTPLTGNPL